MLGDFLELRTRICRGPRIAVQPLPSYWAVPGKCHENVQRVVAKSGGSLQYGWAQADLGPIPVSSCQLPSLYSRWVNHAVSLIVLNDTLCTGTQIDRTVNTSQIGGQPLQGPAHPTASFRDSTLWCFRALALGLSSAGKVDWQFCCRQAGNH